MTINLSDNTPRVSYTVAQGATQTSFTVSFEFFASADLKVYVDGTLKTLTTHYTVSGGNGSTGAVAISVTGATGGSTVVITRDIALERTTDFPAQGSFQIATLNTELDKITAQFADRKDDVDRSLRLEDSDSAVAMTLPLKASRVGTVLGFNASTGAPEAGPTIANVNSLSAITANINTVAGISANVTTVAGISANTTTVAGIASNVTAVAGNATNINALAASAVIADMALLATSDVIADMALLATSDVISDMNTLATSDIVSDLNALATSDIISDMNALATSDIISDMNALATSDIISDLNALATSDIISDMNLLATSAVIADMATLAGSGANPNITTLTASGEIAAASLDISGNVDVDGTLEADAITINGTAIASVLSPVAGSSSIVTTGALNAGSITSGFGAINNGSSAITTTGVGSFGSLDISGDIDIDGTANLDVVDIDGAVDMASTLQVDGAITSSAGATITTADNTAQLILKSTDADASVGPLFQLHRDSSSPADDDAMGTIDFRGENSASEIINYVRINTRSADVTDGTEDAKFDVNTYVGGASVNRFSMTPTETVFNEDSVDVDFRVEGNGDANLLYVDAGNDRIGIGTASPSELLDLYSGSTNARIQVQTNNSSSVPAIEFRNTAAGCQIGMPANVNAMTFTTADTERMRILAGGGLTFNGDTAAANALDDYEEGTWTPTAGGNASYNSQSGFYVKVGGLVHISGIINISSIGTGTTQYISGLPFSSISGTGSESAITVQFVSGSATNFIYICLRSSSNNLWFSFKSASGDSMGINPAILKNGTEVAFAGTYRTDS